MPNQSKAVEAILNLKDAQAIIDLASQGLGPHQIATKLGVSRSHVHEILDQFYQAYSFQLQEHAERMQLQIQLRLEYIYNKAAEYAFPRGDPLIPEEFYEGNQGLVNIMLKVIKQQMEFIRMQHEAQSDAEGRALDIEKYELTITRTSQLYDKALSTMQDDWMSPYLEQDLNTIYMESEETLKNHQELRGLEEKVEEIRQKLPESYRNMEDNEEEIEG